VSNTRDGDYEEKSKSESTDSRTDFSEAGPAHEVGKEQKSQKTKNDSNWSKSATSRLVGSWRATVIHWFTVTHRRVASASIRPPELVFGFWALVLAVLVVHLNVHQALKRENPKTKGQSPKSVFFPFAFSILS
jgi:hypothetical protein